MRGTGADVLGLERMHCQGLGWRTHYPHAIHVWLCCPERHNHTATVLKATSGPRDKWHPGEMGHALPIYLQRHAMELTQLSAVIEESWQRTRAKAAGSLPYITL